VASDCLPVLDARGRGWEQAQDTQVIGDGAVWIWKQAAIHFGKGRQLVTGIPPSNTWRKPPQPETWPQFETRRHWSRLYKIMRLWQTKQSEARRDHALIAVFPLKTVDNSGRGKDSIGRRLPD